MMLGAWGSAGVGSVVLDQVHILADGCKKLSDPYEIDIEHS